MLAKLTKRELDVLRYIAQGLGNKQIAKAMNLSLYTVKNHVHNICEKTGSTTRHEAAQQVLGIQTTNPCSSCPVTKWAGQQGRLKVIAADLRRLANELEGE